MKIRRPIFSVTLLAAMLLALAAGIFWPRDKNQLSPPTGQKSATAATPTAKVLAPARKPPAVSAVEPARRRETFADFQPRPFAVSRESADYGWTAEDGKDPGVIRKLAHNELEFGRMAEESSRIYRRQLVYARQTADFLVQQSKLSGEPVRRLVLPGLDGQEIQFTITRAELSPSGQAGTFSGEITGQPGSMVTLAFKGGREAFTVLSPADKLYLVGEPREPGELIVKSINPETYVVGTCGND